MKIRIMLAFAVCMVIGSIGYAEEVRPAPSTLQIGPSQVQKAPTSIQKETIKISGPIQVQPNPNIWGGIVAGAEEGKFNNPQGIAINLSLGFVYVADKGNNRVQQFKTDGSFVKSITIQSPYDVTVDGYGAVYVFSGADCKIYQYSRYLDLENSWGGYITSAGETGKFYVPCQIKAAISSDSTFYVYASESAANRGSIQKFKDNGQFVKIWRGNAGFYKPRGIAFGPYMDTENKTQYVFYVADEGRHNISIFSEIKGTLIGYVGSKGSANGQFNSPQDVELDLLTNVGLPYIYVADTGNNRIQKFNTHGIYQAQWGSTGTAYGKFKQPRGIAVDRDGNVYVVDSGNNRIQKFLKADIDKLSQQIVN